MRYRLIEAEKAEHRISRLCTVLGVTRQGFYAWRRRGPSLRQLGDDELKKLIVTVYDGSHQTYGAIRVNDELREEHDVHVGRKRVARLMRELGLQGVSRRGKKPRTTTPAEKAPPAPDLVERRFVADRPNALWLADITYVDTREGYLFLAVVMDMYSRKLVGWMSWRGPRVAIRSRPRCQTKGGPEVMLYAAIDIHKQLLHAAVLDPETGAISEQRFAASREELTHWAMPLRGKVNAVAIEATTGWRWVWRELAALGFDVRLADPVQVKALRGRIRRAKTDRLDARWLCLLLAKAMLPECWLPPAEIQALRDKTRLRKALVDDRTRWAQRLHALLTHEGWPCQRRRLLTGEGRRWVSSLALPPAVRAHVETLLRLIVMLDEEVGELDRELRRFARRDPRCQALRSIFGVGPIIACHLLAELGEAKRFRRARQAVRVAGLDPVVEESGEKRRRGRLAKHGSPELRWALVEAAQKASWPSSPDHPLYASVKERSGGQEAALTVARKIAHRAYHVLHELEQAA